EKIDMLDFAEAVVINKFDRRGADDALRDVRRQMVRNREAFGAKPEEMPVFGTVAARFHDDGVTSLYQHLRGLLVDSGLRLPTEGTLAPIDTRVSSAVHPRSEERRVGKEGRSPGCAKRSMDQEVT